MSQKGAAAAIAHLNYDTVLQFPVQYKYLYSKQCINRPRQDSEHGPCSRQSTARCSVDLRGRMIKAWRATSRKWRYVDSTVSLSFRDAKSPTW
jgi:hypothetical protein